MEALKEAYHGKRVWITGHTGFKGAWLCEWLLQLGAEVWGCSLPPPTKPALFEQLGLAARLRHREGDVRDAALVCADLRACRPDYVFHLAAQPLVRRSCREPVETFATNVMGTAHVLEALRSAEAPCGAVFVTTDKCYAPPPPPNGHREGDALGGRDPYSASKAAAELAIAAWREVFVSDAGPEPMRVALASVRAGNVIGGGDWAEDRIVPDCVRALQRGEPVVVRHPSATRPWQHVLDPLYGYLLLGAKLRGALLAENQAGLRELASPYNFGPPSGHEHSVQDVVEALLRHWPGRWVGGVEQGASPETMRLRLDSAKAAAVLGWRPRWDFAESIARTALWYRAVSVDPSTARTITRRQIEDFQTMARR